MANKLGSITAAGILSLSLMGYGALASAHVVPTAVTPSGTLVEAISQNPDNLTPGMGSLAADDGPSSLMNVSLVRLTTADQFVGELATNWTIADHGLKYTFNLNPAAKWSDGQPLTSADVVYSWHYYTNPKIQLTYVTGWSDVASVVANGPHQVIFTLSHAYAPFMSSVALASIVPEHVFSKWTVSQLNHGYYDAHSVVAGPYVLQSWVPDQQLTYVPNPNWWGPPVHIKKIVFSVIPNQDTQFNDLLAGDLTMASVPPQDLSQMSQLKGKDRVIEPLSATYDQITPIEVGFLKDVRVRQALNLATPKQQIVKYIMKGQAEVAFGDQVPGGYWYDPHLHAPSFNLTQAAKILKEDGFTKGKGGWLYKDGKELAVPIWALSNDPTDDNIEQVVSAEWEKIGVYAPVHTAGAALLFGAKGPQFNGKMEALIFSWGQGVFPDDTIDFNSAYAVTSPTSPGENVERYDNPLMNKLTVEGTTFTSNLKRRQVYWDIQKLEIQTVPIIFLFWDKSDFAYSVHLKGYDQTTFATNPVWDWSLQ
ncbi:MAG: ABC transporter substrate-binding protein [Firmicutes bacterium]|jgi:peptide/nickel transport system substrate-binding protein|nr:ABC transporter substrate-binding protein [Bacillota bacterium]MCL5064664.1 ABC transporter substrate-binding protein [Bacillota bacterium]